MNIRPSVQIYSEIYSVAVGHENGKTEKGLQCRHHVKKKNVEMVTWYCSIATLCSDIPPVI